MNKKILISFLFLFSIGYTVMGQEKSEFDKFDQIIPRFRRKK